jgi:hypothetical protein
MRFHTLDKIAYAGSGTLGKYLRDNTVTFKWSKEISGSFVDKRITHRVLVSISY